MSSLRHAPRVLAGFLSLALAATLSHAAGMPAATLASPASVTTTSARLNGSVNPNGSATQVGFQLGTTTAYGTIVYASPASIAATASTTAVSASVSGLQCGTTYHYQLGARNAYGDRRTADGAFTTAACATLPPPPPPPPPPSTVAPTATTSAASGVTQTQATLGGSATAGTASATLSYDFGTTTSYGSSRAGTPASIAANTGSTAFSATVTGLTCGTTYNYRARAVSSAGTGLGSNQSFTTAACTTPPPPPPPPPPPSGNLDCAQANVRCVAPSGANAEYANIQAAVNAAQPGDTVQVFDGNYVGFVVSRGGTPAAPITVKAAGSNVVIDRVNSANEGIRVNNASYVVIEGFTVVGMPAFGLTARGASPTAPMHGVVIRDNTVYNSGSSNIYASQVSDSLLEGNTAYGSGASHGMYLANGGSDNTVIRGNLLYNNASNGLHLNGDLSVGGDGLHQNVTIEDNVIYGNTANGMDLDGVQASTFRNNVVYNNGRHGIRAFQVDGAAGPRNLVFENNTISVKSGNTPIKLTEDGGGHTFFNNILVNEGTSGGSIVVGSPAVKSSNNTFVNPGFSVNAGSSMITLAQWRSSTGGDASSLTSTQDALFVAAATRDYRLKSGSPAANAGLASFNGFQAPADDIAGTARPKGGATDQGAYESF